VPVRHNNQPWVIALRDMLRLSIGPAWSIKEQSGKVKITVRFQDKSKSYATVPIPWLPARSRDIEDAIIKIANLVQGGRTLKEAVEALYGTNKKVPVAVQAPSSQLLRNCWEEFGREKVKNNKIKESTWNTDYAKSFKKIEPVLDQCVDVDTLLSFAGDNLEAGCRSRQIAIQNLAAWLRWAVAKKYLDPTRWEPPAEKSKGIKEFIGEKVGAREEGVPLYDDEILKIIEYIENIGTTASQRWAYVIKLCACYGLRPHEVQYLSVQDIRGTKNVYCSYQKRSGSGKTDSREVFGLHPSWEKNWNLVELIETQEIPFPKFTGGVGESLRKYLLKKRTRPSHLAKNAWNEIVEKRRNKGENVTPYSFRHGWAWRVHTDQRYCNKINTRVAASLMGHSHQTHLEYYGRWVPTGSIRSSLNELLG